MNGHAAVMVYAPNQAGEQFMQTLSEGGHSFAVVACSPAEQRYLSARGLTNIVRINFKEQSLIYSSENEFSRVYIFEEELGRCCKVLDIIRKWTNGIIYVITTKHYPQMMYRMLGANYVIRTTKDDVSFLIENEVF
ncbi:hypothetical protein D3C74_209030 [compost metagenome]